MTTWTKLDITQKRISQIRFCKKTPIVENFNYQTRSTDGMVFSSKQILNVHRIYKLQFISKINQAYLDCNCTKPCFKRGDRFFSAVTWVLQLHTVWNQKKIGMLTLLNCEAVSLTLFTTMCPKQQQTGDYLIVKRYCFVIEIFCGKQTLFTSLLGHNFVTRILFKQV